MFNNKHYLASGTYGKVFRVEYNGSLACMKEYRCPADKNGVSDDILKEIFHYCLPYAKISIYYISNDFKKIIVDLYDGDLYLYKKDSSYNCSETELINIKTQVLEQLYVLHSHGFIHSDIKIGNILLNKPKNIYTICDFGLCEYYGFPAIKKQYMCTEYFKAPSNGTRNNINYDIYSLGATLYFLNNGAFKHTIEKNTVFNENITCLINYDHNISAKKLLNLNKKDTKKTKYFKNIISKLGLKKEDYHTHTFNENIFLNLSIKNNAYHNYIFEKNDKFELEYLDDMFIMYMKNNFHFNSNIKIDEKLYLLKIHKKYNTHLETLLFSWFLLDNVPFSGLLDNETEAEIYFNFSCKILEFNNISQINVFIMSIIDVERNLINQFIHKKIVFTPAIFYIYYFLYKLAYEFPNQYYLEYRILESIVLGMLMVYLCRPIKYDRNMTYVKLSYHIIMNSIDFLNNNKIEGKMDEILKETISMLDNDTIDIIIENIQLKNYLTLNHTL